MGRSLPILGVPGVLDGGGGIDWLLRDEFTTAESAPLTSPRACEPGPGGLIITQADATFAIAGGAFTQLTASVSDKREGFTGTETYTRTAGLALFWRAAMLSAVGSASRSPRYSAVQNPNDTVDNMSFGFTVDGIYWDTGNFLCHPAKLSLDTFYEIAHVLRATGGHLFLKDGETWKLVWVDPFSTKNLTPQVGVISMGRRGFAVSHLRARQLPLPFSDDSFVAVNEAAPVSGTAYTSVADGLHHLTVTAPVPLANSVELRYRVLDDENYWTAYFDDEGAFNLDSVAGGVATNRINVAAAIAAGETLTLVAICEDTKHNCYSQLAHATNRRFAKRGSEINVSHQDTQTTLKPVAGVGWTLGRLTSWPRTDAAYAELDKVSP